VYVCVEIVEIQRPITNSNNKLKKKGEKRSLFDFKVDTQ
jgi:hypothetical protein